MSTIHKATLVTPPYHSGVVESAGTWLNLGFVYIAGALRQAGCEVDYYDAMALWHGWEDIATRIADFSPDLVATTAYTASVVDAIELLKRVKERHPRTLTVLGNVHPTFCYQEIFSDPACPVDFIVRGEGERTLPALIACLNAGDDPARVPGLAFRRDKGVTVTAAAAFIDDLDSLAPAWDLVDWPRYSYHPKPGSRLAIVSSSRGCVQHCSFCSQQLFWQRRWRARRPEHFVAELEHLRDRHGVDVVMLADETPTLNRQRWQRILELMIERRVGVKLLMETRVDDILRDADIMGLYRQAGVEHIYVGVEAGRQETLDLFRKGTKVEQSKQAIDLINAADIVSETSFVLGMPDETPESIRRTVDLARHYDPDMGFFLAIAPWPYSDLYPELADHVATTDYRRYNLVEPVVRPRAMTLAEVERQLGFAARDFYLHRFRNLGRLSPWKQEFMLAVFRILIDNSYLAGQMRAMAADSHGMPEKMQNMLAAGTGTNAPIPPIP